MRINGKNEACEIDLKIEFEIKLTVTVFMMKRLKLSHLRKIFG